MPLNYTGPGSYIPLIGVFTLILIEANTVFKYSLCVRGFGTYMLNGGFTSCIHSCLDAECLSQQGISLGTWEGRMIHGYYMLVKQDGVTVVVVEIIEQKVHGHINSLGN